MVRSYLIFYNVALTLLWGAYLIYMLLNGFQLDETSLLLLNIAQLAAILEIGHAALKWVKSSAFTTFIQVFSRIFVLLLLNLMPNGPFIGCCGINGLVLITLAWSITEVVRYSYYTTILLNNESSILLTLRYTLFLVLYPMGVIGEALIIVSYLQNQDWAMTLPNIVIGLIFLSYFYFFPQMYKHMLKQRKKKLA